MKRKMLFLSVISAVIMVASIFGSFILADRYHSYPIILPEPSSQPNIGSLEPPVPSDAAINIRPLTVNTENAFLLLASVRRPQDFTATFDAVWYWPGGEAKKTYTMYSREQMLKLEDNGGLVRYLNKGGYFYHWNALNANNIYSVPDEGDFSMDKWAGIPTYESISTVDEIVKADYIEDENLLILETLGPVYRCFYQISLETMFLHKAEYWEGERLAYSYNIVSFQQGKPAIELFDIP